MVTKQQMDSLKNMDSQVALQTVREIIDSGNRKVVAVCFTGRALLSFLSFVNQETPIQFNGCCYKTHRTFGELVSSIEYGVKYAVYVSSTECSVFDLENHEIDHIDVIWRSLYYPIRA